MQLPDTTSVVVNETCFKPAQYSSFKDLRGKNGDVKMLMTNLSWQQ